MQAYTHFFLFSFWMFRNDVCISRFHLSVKAKATLCFCQQISTDGTITLYFDYLLFHDEKTHPPRVYVSLATNNICTFCCVVCQTYTECDIFRFTFQMFEGKLYSFHIYVWTYLPLWSLLTIIIIFCSCFLANLNFWCINKICNGRNLQNKNLVLCLFSVQETTIWIRAPNICLYRAKFK